MKIRSLYAHVHNMVFHDSENLRTKVGSSKKFNRNFHYNISCRQKLDKFEQIIQKVQWCSIILSIFGVTFFYHHILQLDTFSIYNLEQKKSKQMLPIVFGKKVSKLILWIITRMGFNLDKIKF